MNILFALVLVVGAEYIRVAGSRQYLGHRNGRIVLTGRSGAAHFYRERAGFSDAFYTRIKFMANGAWHVLGGGSRLGAVHYPGGQEDRFKITLNSKNSFELRNSRGGCVSGGRSSVGMGSCYRPMRFVFENRFKVPDLRRSKATRSAMAVSDWIKEEMLSGHYGRRSGMLETYERRVGRMRRYRRPIIAEYYVEII
ncbi:hypothetical protein ECANGB1_2694 [Enterospora canceri]|uniref:Uncharacterized protein n=1 Tax=Enterospora canceri TaxID=1081671 RepID=A0A1Y1SA96_9MICR|nr:hypothetical protein ECANGB1_2694 [Enterospora canceri]